MDSIARRKQLLTRRRKSGFSITELLTSTLIFGVCVAMIGEVSVLSTKGTLKTTNTSDAAARVRNLLNRISNDVRQARAFGDFYGTGLERLQFPSSTNPIYTASRQPLNGWPAAPWSSPIVLSDTTLIVQTPVVFVNPNNDPQSSQYLSGASVDPRNGMPLMLPKGNFGTALDPPCNMENLDTVIYSVVPDSARPGEFLLQVARFPGAEIKNLSSTICSYKGLINPPQTLLRGIIGPKSPGSLATDPPRVFSYLHRETKPKPPGTYVLKNVDSTNIGEIQGVAVDIEIRSTGLSSTATSSNDQIIGLHEESYMRYNSHAVLNNTSLLP